MPDDDSAPHRSGEPDRRLESWKEIAVYFDRGVRTVRRWEKDEGLPVHRHAHNKQGTIYGLSGSIDSANVESVKVEALEKDKR